jgi:hypothetical protein
MNTRLLIPLLLAGAIALACGSRSRADASARSVTTNQVSTLAAAVLPTSAPVRRTGRPGDTVSVRINPAFAITTEQKSLRFNLVIRNEGRKHVELAFPNGQEYDFAVVDGRGREVYRWGNGRMFTQSRQNRVLDGGDTMRIEERASPALAPGSYVAVATLHSSNFPVEQRVPFELR